MARTRISDFVPVLLLIGCIRISMGQDVESRLAQMPRPWEGEKIHRVTLDEYRATDTSGGRYHRA